MTGARRPPRAQGALGLWLGVLASTWVHAAPPSLPPSSEQVPEQVRSALGLSPWYRQYLEAQGLAVVGSARVSGTAMRKAASVVEKLLAGRPDLAQALRRHKVRVAVMAASEVTTDVPEHADLKPAEVWNRRARGLGATVARPAVSCAEENLLRRRNDSYRGENICIHELAHAIHELALDSVDPTFDLRLRQAYAAAVAKGLWKGTYAAQDAKEYWAEGVQSWFDANQRKGAFHNGVRTRGDLERYDASLAKLLAEVFGTQSEAHVLE